MTTEEIHFNERLEEHQLEAVETDLGEYILQLAHQRPYHIVAPALHLTRYDVAEIFTKNLGVENEVVIENQTKIARATLREKFLEADIGVTGANFLVADSGAVVVVENEGNARLTSSAPKIHIAVAGIEKVIPRAQDLAVFLNLLGRSATGQPLTVYTSFLSGPRRGGEIDGPDEFYVVLLDNGRTKLLADPEKRQSLYCIRCGACLNHCPVYRKIGGHNYPWVYSGPIGAIITPQFHGVHKDTWLPFASSLCGACAEVCPVKIEIPKLLLEAARRSDRGEAARRRGRHGTLRVPDLGLGDDSSENLFAARRAWSEASRRYCRRWGRSESGPASVKCRSLRRQSFHQWWAARKGATVNSRELILGKVRKALGGAAGLDYDHSRGPTIAHPSDRTATFMQVSSAKTSKSWRENVFLLPEPAAVVPALADLLHRKACCCVECAVSYYLRDYASSPGARPDSPIARRCVPRVPTPTSALHRRLCAWPRPGHS